MDGRRYAGTVAYGLLAVAERCVRRAITVRLAFRDWLERQAYEAESARQEAEGSPEHGQLRRRIR